MCKCACAHKVTNVFQWCVYNGTLIFNAYVFGYHLSFLISLISSPPRKKIKLKVWVFFTPINLLEKDLVVIDTNLPWETPVRRKHTEKKVMYLSLLNTAH